MLATLTADGKNIPVTTECLTSAGNTNCSPISHSIMDLSIPTPFNALNSKITDLGQGLNGANAISGGTLAAASSLASKHSAISKLANSLKNKINDNLAKKQLPKIDFLNLDNKLWDKMKLQTSKALRDGGMSAAQFLNGPGIMSNSSAAVPPVSSKEPSLHSTQNTYSGFTTSASPVSSGLNNSKNDIEENKDLHASLKEEADNLKPKEEHYDFGSMDISTNRGDSIFQIISNRYTKSAYQRLFDKIPEKE